MGWERFPAGLPPKQVVAGFVCDPYRGSIKAKSKWTVSDWRCVDELPSDAIELSDRVGAGVCDPNRAAIENDSGGCSFDRVRSDGFAVLAQARHSIRTLVCYFNVRAVEAKGLGLCADWK